MKFLLRALHICHDGVLRAGAARPGLSFDLAKSCIRSGGAAYMTRRVCGGANAIRFIDGLLFFFLLIALGLLRWYVNINGGDTVEYIIVLEISCYRVFSWSFYVSRVPWGQQHN